MKKPGLMMTRSSASYSVCLASTVASLPTPGTALRSRRSSLKHGRCRSSLVQSFLRRRHKEQLWYRDAARRPVSKRQQRRPRRVVRLRTKQRVHVAARRSREADGRRIISGKPGRGVGRNLLKPFGHRKDNLWGHRRRARFLPAAPALCRSYTADS